MTTELNDKKPKDNSPGAADADRVEGGSSPPTCKVDGCTAAVTGRRKWCDEHRKWKAPEPDTYLPKGKAWLPTGLLELHDAEAYAVYGVLKTFSWLESPKHKWPSVYTVTYWTGLDPKVVRAKLILLEAVGWITVNGKRGGEGQRTITRYTVNDSVGPVEPNKIEPVGSQQPNETKPVGSQQPNQMGQDDPTKPDSVGSQRPTPGSSSKVVDVDKRESSPPLSSTPSGSAGETIEQLRAAFASVDQNQLDDVSRGQMKLIAAKLNRGRRPSEGLIDALMSLTPRQGAKDVPRAPEKTVPREETRPTPIKEEARKPTPVTEAPRPAPEKPKPVPRPVDPEAKERAKEWDRLVKARDETARLERAKQYKAGRKPGDINPYENPEVVAASKAFDEFNALYDGDGYPKTNGGRS